MKALCILASSLILLTAGYAVAQESDYEIKTNFESAYTALKNAIDASKTVQELDVLNRQIDSLETAYSPHRAFLDKALYPETFTQAMQNMRSLQLRTLERVSLIQAQGGRIVEMEQQISILTSRLDSLSAERDQLLAELRDTKKSLAALRETVKRLQANMQAKDRLIFALVDSIFLPYDKNINQLGDVQKDALAQRLLKSNVLTRIYDITADNVKFLEMTSLQPKDYAGLIDQEQQFRAKWLGLRDKIRLMYETSAARAGGPGGGARAAERSPAAHVDSSLGEWGRRLQVNLWAAISREFAEHGVAFPPFTDGKSFAASMRQYIESTKASGADASVFVNDIWKNRIDKEWRDALTKESMLGKVEYAALDKAVSELAGPKFDFKILLYAVGLVILVSILWWFFRKKPAAPPAK